MPTFSRCMLRQAGEGSDCGPKRFGTEKESHRDGAGRAVSEMNRLVRRGREGRAAPQGRGPPLPRQTDPREDRQSRCGKNAHNRWIHMRLFSFQLL